MMQNSESGEVTLLEIWNRVAFLHIQCEFSNTADGDTIHNSRLKTVEQTTQERNNIFATFFVWFWVFLKKVFILFFAF